MTKIHERKGFFDVWMGDTHIDINPTEGHISIQNRGLDFKDIKKELQKIYKQLNINKLVMKRAEDQKTINGNVCNIDYNIENDQTIISCTRNTGTDELPVYETIQAIKREGKVYFNQMPYNAWGKAQMEAMGAWLETEETTIVTTLKSL